MDTKRIQVNYSINRMSAVDLISVIHIDDHNTRFIELVLSDQGSPFPVTGSTVIARFATAKGVLLSDNVSCTVTEDGNILIPIDAAAVNSVACDLKIEVNITQGTDVLTLPFPLWVRVRGSILETSGISPESQGTIPDLLHQVEEELQRVQGFTDEEEVYEILDNTLSGNRNISPTLLVDRVTDQTYNPNGDLILYYIDSDDVRHNIFNFTEVLCSNEAVTEMIDTALSGDSYGQNMTLNLDNNVDQAANPYGHLMLYYIDSDWTRHNIFDFTQDLSLRGDRIFPGTIDWYRLDDLAQASIFRDYGRKGYPEPDLMTNPSKLFMNGVCYIDNTTLAGLPVAQAGYWIKIHSAYTPSGTSWTNYIEFYIAESSDRVFLRHIFQGQYTSWQEIGVKVSSAAVNQNGTITLTMSDGSTVTTTGQSVIGPQGPAGSDYILTAQDKSDIADLVLAELPTTQGVQYGNTGN